MTDRRPIEVTFPIEEVNEIANREAHAKRYYRPVYTMHKWWARRLGSVFRTMLLYALAEETPPVEGGQQSELDGENGLPKITDENPEDLWEYYLEDVDFEDKTILDPFMGGGTSIVEALRLGCNAIGGELSPVAWFIVKKQVEAVDLDDLDTAYDRLEAEVGPEIRHYYRTECPHCETDEDYDDIYGGNAEPDGCHGYADAMYYFWVKLLPCRNCGEDVALFKDYRLASARSSKDNYYNVVCPDCWHIFQTDDHKTETECPECDHEFVPYDAKNVSGTTYTCPHCDEHPEMDIIESVDRFGKPEEKLFAVEYYCPEKDEKGYQPATEFDHELCETASEELAGKRDQLPIPTQERYEGSSDRARNHGYETYDQMFNDRQLLCLSKLLSQINELDDQNVKEFLLLAFSSATEFNNMLCEYNRTANKLEGVYKRHTILSRHQPIENKCVFSPDEFRHCLVAGDQSRGYVPSARAN